MSFLSALKGIVDPGGDPAALQRAAAAYRELATQLNSVASDLDNAVSQNIEAHWKGSASVAFQKQWSTFSAAIKNYAKSLDGAASNLDAMANELHNAHEQVIHLAIVAAASIAAGLALTFFTFGGSDAAAAAEVAVDTADAADVIATTDEAVSEGASFFSRFLADDPMSRFQMVAGRFAMGSGISLAQEMGTKFFLQHENPFDLANYSAEDISNVLLGGDLTAGLGMVGFDASTAAAGTKLSGLSDLLTGSVRNDLGEITGKSALKAGLGNAAYGAAGGVLGSSISQFGLNGKPLDLSTLETVGLSGLISGGTGGVMGAGFTALKGGGDGLTSPDGADGGPAAIAPSLPELGAPAAPDPTVADPGGGTPSPDTGGTSATGPDGGAAAPPPAPDGGAPTTAAAPDGGAGATPHVGGTGDGAGTPPSGGGSAGAGDGAAAPSGGPDPTGAAGASSHAGVPGDGAGAPHTGGPDAAGGAGAAPHGGGSPDGATSGEAASTPPLSQDQVQALQSRIDDLRAQADNAAQSRFLHPANPEQADALNAQANQLNRILKANAMGSDSRTPPFEAEQARASAQNLLGKYAPDLHTEPPPAGDGSAAGATPPPPDPGAASTPPPDAGSATTPPPDGAQATAPPGPNRVAEALNGLSQKTGIDGGDVVRATIGLPSGAISYSFNFPHTSTPDMGGPPPPTSPAPAPNVPVSPPPPLPPHHTPPSPPAPPNPPAPPAPPTPPPSAPIGGGSVTVQPGDSLYQIAGRELGNPNLYPLIEAANPGAIGPNGLIMPGQVLHIPQLPAPPAHSTTQVVQPGQDLWEIAGGNPALVDQIAALNHLSDPNLIEVGQVLIIPASA